MRLLYLMLPALVLSVSAAAQSTPVAEIIRYDKVLSVTSATEAKLVVTERIRVNSENGADLAIFTYSTDRYNVISSFSGKIDAGGKTIKKLRQSDIETVKFSDSFADDSYVNYYRPVSTYPYEVEYNYTISMKNAIAVYPSFFPLFRANVSLHEASYEIDVPSGTEIQYRSSQEPLVENTPRQDVYKWIVKDIPAFRKEAGMPDAESFLPFVYVCPLEFSYLGYKGSQSSWKSVGRWLYDIFPQDSSLPDGLVAKIRESVADCNSDLEKLRALYNFLRDNTRYVSIQLGIGGFAPASPSEVFRTGYGDCKALSYYMKMMLAELGINSEYTIVDTDSRTLRRGFSSIGQMDHAMLCVPMQNDTVWVECTNPRVPLGFRTSSIAGHQNVLIKEDGGELVRAAGYPDSLRVSTDVMEVNLAGDGSARVKVNRTRVLDDAMPYVEFNTLEKKTADRMLTSAFNCHADNVSLDSFKDNFMDYAGGDYVPEVHLGYSFTTGTLAKLAGDRIIVPVSVFKKGLSYQRSKREYDYTGFSGEKIVEICTFTVPEGFLIETVPENVNVNCQFADYSMIYEVKDNAVTVSFSFKMKPFHIKAEEYSSYREFVKDFNKSVATDIVLKRG